MRPNRCDCCGGKFGLVLHRSWGKGFCSKHCKRVHREQKRSQRPWNRFIDHFFGLSLTEQLAMLLDANERTAMATVKPGRPGGPAR
jgi:hypothetical protein